jgi:hypothetical protein
VRFKVGLDKNLDDLLARVNFDGYQIRPYRNLRAKSDAKKRRLFQSVMLTPERDRWLEPGSLQQRVVSLGISPLHDERDAALGVTAPPSILARAAEVNE